MCDSTISPPNSSSALCFTKPCEFFSSCNSSLFLAVRYGMFADLVGSNMPSLMYVAMHAAVLTIMAEVLPSLHARCRYPEGIDYATV